MKLKKRMTIIMVLVLSLISNVIVYGNPANGVKSGKHSEKYRDRYNAYNWEITGNDNDLSLNLTCSDYYELYLQNRYYEGDDYLYDDVSGKYSVVPVSKIKHVTVGEGFNAFNMDFLKPGGSPWEKYTVEKKSDLESLSLPSTLSENRFLAESGFPALKTVAFSRNNPNYSIAEGALTGSFLAEFYDGDFYSYSEDGFDNSKWSDKKVNGVLLYPAARDGESYTIPEGVEAIGRGAFAMASKLKKITIPETVIYIAGETPFYGCTGITEINIPASVEEISLNSDGLDCCAFDGMPNLESINVDSKNKNFASEKGVLYNKDKTVFLKMPEGFKSDKYAFASTLKYLPFPVNDNIKAIEIPAGVEHLGEDFHYFLDESSLEDIYYKGSKEQWEKLWEEEFEEEYNKNNEEIKMHYNSEMPKDLDDTPEPDTPDKPTVSKNTLSSATIPGGTGIVEIQSETEETGENGYDISEINIPMELAVSILTSEEKQRVMAGEKLTVTLKVTDKSSTMTDKEKADYLSKVKSCVGDDAVIGLFLDISLIKTVGNDEPQEVHSTGGKTLSFRMKVPASAINTDTDVERTYYLIHIHDNKAEIVKETTDTEFDVEEKNGFSIWCLSYVGRNKETDKSGDNSSEDNTSGEKKITVSDNLPMAYSEETRGDFRIGYCHEIPFYGKAKPALEFFDGITVSINEAEYKVNKIKVNKKSSIIQITGLEGADKDTVKKLKKATKGSSGLSFTVNPYYVKDTDTVTPKFKKDGSIKSVKVRIKDKDYKAKKTEFSYDTDSKTINFSGSNLNGSKKLS